MTIEERVQFLMRSSESHDRQLGELTDKMAALTAKFDALGGMMAQLLGAMKTLADTTNAGLLALRGRHDALKRFATLCR